MAELNGALIGCGFFAINQMHAWKDVSGAKIEAICDRDPERLKIVGDQFGIERRYTDAKALFADGGIDFVDIATTVASHRALVELAAAHKVPAICQKPFAKTLDDAKAMVKVCDEVGIPLMVHENFRWQTPIQAVRTALDSGVIGASFWGRFSFRSGFDVFSGQPYLAEGERFIIEDLGIHTLDIARFILGDVTSLVARTKRVNPKIKGEDVATILMDHENGATSVVDVSYATKHETDPFPETLIELDGTEGSIRLYQGYRLEVITSGVRQFPTFRQNCSPGPRVRGTIFRKAFLPFSSIGWINSLPVQKPRHRAQTISRPLRLSRLPMTVQQAAIASTSRHC